MLTAGLPEAVVLRPGDTALLLIDFQREYGADGRLPLPGLGAAAMLAQRLAESFDQRAALVIHVHHVARAICGVDYRWILPYTAVTGAILVTFADTIGRVVQRPQEIPIGVMLAFVGAPFFIYLARWKVR